MLYYALIVLQISRQSFEAFVSYSDFKKFYKKGGKNEEIKTNFEGTYFENGLVDSAQIWNWRCPTPREFAQKISCVSVRGVSSYRCMKMVFSLLL